MILSQLVFLSQTIKEKQEMHQLASQKGLTNPDVIKISQDIDECINRYQQILLNQPGLNQLLRIQ